MKYIIVLISCLLANTTFGQEKDKFLFSGIVLDSDSINNPIPSTNIFLKNGMGTKTNINGEFSINVAKGDSLIFSHIGFHRLIIIISDLALLNRKIYLTKDTIDIDEVLIYPHQNYEEFKVAFVNIPLEYDLEVLNAKYNIGLCLYQARSGISLEWTAEDMAEYTIKQLSSNVIYAGQISPENMIAFNQMIMGISSFFSDDRQDIDFLESLNRQRTQFHYSRKKQYY